MADDFDDGMDEAFKGFGEEPGTPPVVAPVDPVIPPVAPGAAAEPPKVDPPKPAEEPKKDDVTPPEPPKGEDGTPPADPAKKPEEGAEPPKAPETPPAPATPEEPKPLTEDGLRSIISEVRNEERTSVQAVETATKEVLEAYYAEGLSNVLVDQSSGKELRTPQDVVDASGGEMSMDAATQCLMNEQYKLDNEVAKIKEDAKGIAETTLKFKQDGVIVLQRYEPIFKAYPQLQSKIWAQFSKLVKADEAKGVILSAPDMAEFYDTVLEPYRLAYEYSTKNPGTNPTPDPATPPPAAPGAEDRLDEGGDGGSSGEVDDPNDFAQQVKKELAKGI